MKQTKAQTHNLTLNKHIVGTSTLASRHEKVVRSDDSYSQEIKPDMQATML